MKVAVVGCGAMGAATAWRLAARGADVVCFDRFSPPHDRGSSHGESRITRTAYFEGAFYVPLLQETFPMWRALEAATRAQLLTLNGLMTIGLPSSPTIASTLASATAHGLEVRVLDAAEMRARYPNHVVADDEIAVFDAQAGYLRPEAAVEAMLRGITVHRNTVVEDIKPTSNGVALNARNGSGAFDAMVLATGPWIRELFPALPAKVLRQVLVWLAIQSGVDSFSPKIFPVWYRDGTPQGHVYGFPTLDGHAIKLAAHQKDDPTDPERIHRAVTDSDLDPIRLFVTTYLRGVTRHVTRSVTCMYTNTPDEHFVIDLHPDSPRIVVLSVCSGHGFKFAPVIGDIAADLVLDGGTRRDISRFALSRFAAS
jgi:sarcosine oxidase